MDFIGENGCSSLVVESRLDLLKLAGFAGDMESIFMGIAGIEFRLF
jgi:hypothetical protein